MKRRNAECGKLRRPLKRNKITEGIYGSTLLYLKFLVLWALVLLADFILEFRFEFLWPFWMLVRSVYDSFKYQGLAFSVFFICIALTSDMISFFFIPVHWLFFAASTYVWVQYVWHTEKGVCLPTIILWLLFIYIEAAVRLRDLRHLPFHLDLCRPFAAHCIGYPVVTLGFGFKSYLGYRMRQRRQKDVAKENEFYAKLLQQALPIDLHQQSQNLQQNHQSCISTSPERSKGSVASSDNNTQANGGSHHSGPPQQQTVNTTKNNHRKSLDKGERDKSTDGDSKCSEKISHTKICNSDGGIHSELEYMERVGSVNDFDENEVEKDKSFKGSLKTNSSKWNGNQQVRENAVISQRDKKNRSNRDSADPVVANHKDEHYMRLEGDVKRLKIDLQASRQVEQDLRCQINVLLSGERSVKSELSQLQQDNDDLQTKLHGLVTARQSDKLTISQLERRLHDERRSRGVCEAQLAAERKARKVEESAAARTIAVAAAAAAASANKGECTESCRARRRDLEAEVKQLRRELKLKEDRCLAAEREVQTLRQYKESHNETEILMSALSAMQEKNAHLENSLSAETRIKLDLFSALGEAKRQLEIQDSEIRAQDKEIDDLKRKIAQVLAVMPTDSFSPSTVSLELSGSGGTSKLLLVEPLLSPVNPPAHLLGPSSSPSILMSAPMVPAPSTSSTLDPNATAYTPKGTSGGSCGGSGVSGGNGSLVAAIASTEA
ncbi:macoilin isoform X2 [Ischnura elegans]|uniref:macoilin isoform X2 n=1 Tax=Ischnura elegans TaxID=197161 RepID=UPI001ED8B404|nr:macoilin isoform X2 [Ischnura elegans]